MDKKEILDILDNAKDERGAVPMRLVRQAFNKLPSVQSEIIRCKDCKWYGRADKRRFYCGMDCLQRRIDTIVPDKDFCSRAERRTDG